MIAKHKQIEAAARIAGEEFDRYIKCALDESTGRPIAVLLWPHQADNKKLCYPLEPSELLPSSTEGVDYIYTGEPLPIPKDLAEIERLSEPLSPERLRLGFFFLAGNRPR